MFSLLKASSLSKRFSFLLFAAVIITGLSLPAFTAEAKNTKRVLGVVNEQGQFNYAKFLIDSDPKRATSEFRRFVKNFPGSSLTEEARLLTGESYLKAKLFGKAIYSLEEFIGSTSNANLKERGTWALAEAKAKAKVSNDASAPPKGLKRVRLGGSENTMRGVQVLLFEGRSRPEIRKEIAKISSSGVDTLIVRIFHNRGDRPHRFVDPKRAGKIKAGVYFNTTHAPVVEDILGFVLRESHKRGLKVFAWMTTRYADYGLEDRVDLACRGYDLNSKEFYRCKGLDVLNKKAVGHLVKLYEDLAEYPIDGILFQDDLVLKHTEGFSEASLKSFKLWSGSTLKPESLYIRMEDSDYVEYTPAFWEWVSWKNRRLLGVADTIKRAVRKKNPEVKFAINFMYESVLSPPSALAWFSQDLSRAVESGFDYYSIMAYHRQMGDELDKGSREIADIIESMVEEAVGVVGDPSKVLIKLQTVDWKTGKSLPNREVVRLIRRVKRVAPVSVAVVPYRSDFPFEELKDLKDRAGLVVLEGDTYAIR